MSVPVGVVCLSPPRICIGKIKKPFFFYFFASERRLRRFRKSLTSYLFNKCVFNCYFIIYIDRGHIIHFWHKQLLCVYVCKTHACPFPHHLYLPRAYYTATSLLLIHICHNIYSSFIFYCLYLFIASTTLLNYYYHPSTSTHLSLVSPDRLYVCV